MNLNLGFLFKNSFFFFNHGIKHLKIGAAPPVLKMVLKMASPTVLNFSLDFCFSFNLARFKCFYTYAVFFFLMSYYYLLVCRYSVQLSNVIL